MKITKQDRQLRKKIRKERAKADRERAIRIKRFGLPKDFYDDVDLW